MIVSPAATDYPLGQSPEEWTARRIECELDRLYFTRYFWKQTKGAKMLLGWHHHAINDALDRVVAGEISRLIINVPPRYTKTEQAVISFMAAELAKNPRARFLHLSASHDLALLNSSQARNIVKSENFQRMWPIQTRDDTDSKSIWYTEDGGGVRASSADGQVTGFGAGLMEAGFNGALIIDDPLKPKDSLSPTKRDAVNANYNDTIASRIAQESTPIIVIMQRVHYYDLSGYLLRGGSGEMWHHLDLPIHSGLADPYPYEENTHAIRIDTEGRPEGWLWPEKHGDQHLGKLRSSKRVWQAQALQRPKKFDEQGALWTEKLIEDAKLKPKPWPLERTVVGVDPSVKNDGDSDDCGIVVASSYKRDGAENPREYSVDADFTDNYTTKQWAKAAINAYHQHNADAIVVEVNNGGDLCIDAFRNEGFTGRVIKRNASKSKWARAEPIAQLYELGLVHHGDGLIDVEAELCEYNPKTATSSPNRLDAVVWALTELSDAELESGVFDW